MNTWYYHRHFIYRPYESNSGMETEEFKKAFREDFCRYLRKNPEIRYSNIRFDNDDETWKNIHVVKNGKEIAEFHITSGASYYREGRHNETGEEIRIKNRNNWQEAKKIVRELL